MNQERVAPAVFMGRVIEATTEMERLNEEDNRRLYITRRGMRLGGMGAWVWLMFGSLVVPGIGLVVAGLSLQNSGWQTVAPVYTAIMLLVPAGWLFTMAFYARWRLWRNVVIGGLATFLFVALFCGGMTALTGG